jgi:hypothetical protein
MLRVQGLLDVLESARQVAARATWVAVDEAAARAWAANHESADWEAPSWPAELRFVGDRAACANLTLLLSCLNFCFWSDRTWAIEFRGRRWRRTYAMYAAVLRAVEEDRSWLHARRWMTAGPVAVAQMFRGLGVIPLLAERREVLNETGRCLSERFGGDFTAAVEQAGGHARRLAYLLAENFPSFRDVATYGDIQVAVLKRAQLCAADVHHRWLRCGFDGLSGLDELTVFADYRLPQYLRHIGVLVVKPELAARIERREEIAAGSPEEVELRCATIVAAEMIREVLGGRIPAWHLDYVLWRRSHDPDVQVEHHRTRTIYY